MCGDSMEEVLKRPHSDDYEGAKAFSKSKHTSTFDSFGLILMTNNCTINVV